MIGGFPLKNEFDQWLLINFQFPFQWTKQYYWNQSGSLITNWPTGNNIMNTKAVETIYEAGHVLYAGQMEKIKQGVWMGRPPYGKNNPHLFEVSEFECLDIDYELRYDNPIIGNQRNKINLYEDNLEDIFNSRTFCLYEDIEVIKSIEFKVDLKKA